MGLKLLELKEDHEFEPLMPVFRAGFIDPGHPLWPIYTADLKPYSETQSQAVYKECAERFLEWHKHDPTSHWLKVVDDDTGEIVAGGRWGIFKKDGPNPYDGHGPVTPTWFPEGSLRTVAGKLINDFLASATKHVNYPHAFLNIIFTAPEHRRRGAAALIMDWGMAQAKEHDLDVFIEATPEGKPLYLRYGFHVIEEQSLELGELTDLVEDDPDLKEKVYNNFIPCTWSSMKKLA